MTVLPQNQQAFDRAVSTYHARQFQLAEAACREILAAEPENLDVLNLQMAAQAGQGAQARALETCERILVLEPDLAEAHYNRGAILRGLGRSLDALASYDRAIALRPDYAEALNNRGNVLLALERPAEALDSFAAALRLKPGLAESHLGQGNSYRALERYAEALASYDVVLALRPDDAETHHRRGMTLRALDRQEEAVAAYDRALAVRPDHAHTLTNRGNALQDLRRYDEALLNFEAALKLASDQPFAFSGIADCVLKLCDWDRRAKVIAALPGRIADPATIISPFVVLGYTGDAALQQQTARKFTAAKIAAPDQPVWNGQPYSHRKIRIAYVSADFRAHPMSHLIVGMFERHDRKKFEIHGISFGPDDGSPIRTRVAAAFDAFHDVRALSDKQIAEKMVELEIDIAIDLMGYTQASRTGIFAHRAAPVQVSYLGFPATMGAPFIDYIIADPVVLPFDQQPFYDEKIVHLPECYWVNDETLKVPEATPTRAMAALPEGAFVFACLNASWKFTPEVFEVWVRLLGEVPGSVLWLYRNNESAERNLRIEAQRRGMDPSRLVFAGPMAFEQHLARHRLADLFLDTLPYNAHTSATDALWTGLPVVTCKGEGFAGRVAASLLQAVGLPDLVTPNLGDYEALALALASNPARLAEVKNRLAANRTTEPLFNTGRFTRHMEAAYEGMWGRWRRGLPPEGFAVGAL